MSDSGAIDIRPFEDADEGAVAALWKQVFPHDPPWNEPYLVMAKKRAVQRDLFLVAMENGALAGTAMGGYDGHRGWIYALAVRPDLRRQGLGARLMARLESALSDLGCPKVNLQVRDGNEDVVAFYQRLGYTVEQRVSLGKLL
jgi:ribosomal protein S18 acetylase RimI-like enzyme